jgi:hypothetical protein
MFTLEISTSCSRFSLGGPKSQIRQLCQLAVSDICDITPSEFAISENYHYTFLSFSSFAFVYSSFSSFLSFFLFYLHTHERSQLKVRLSIRFGNVLYHLQFKTFPYFIYASLNLFRCSILSHSADLNILNTGIFS